MQMFEVNPSFSMQRHPVNPSPTGMRLYDTQGHRLYLTSSEREAFRKAAEKAPREVRTYCHTLLYTGCRPSEAMALTADRVDFQAQAITFESKKKGSVAKFDFWAKSKNRVSGIQ
jgi:integrase